MSDNKELELRKRIVAFVKNNFQKWDFERASDHERIEEFGFASLKEMYAFNEKKILEADNDLLMLMKLLMEMTGKVSLMDKESMVAFKASGFCFGKNGKFIIFNER